jgi:hypothetical protein
MKLLGIFFFCLLYSLSGQAQVLSQDQIESKVQSDLSGLLDKILEPHQYSLQVTAVMDRVNERQLVEGEQLTQPSQLSRTVVPPLPGFDPPANSPQPPSPTQTRQVFRMVEKPVLKALTAHLLLDQSVDKEKSKTIETLARSYLNNSFAGTAHLEMRQTALKGPTASSGLKIDNLSSLAWILVAGLALWLFILLRRRKPALLSGMSPDQLLPLRPEEREVGKSIAANEMMALPPPEKRRERTAFSGVPTNPQYADHRRQLLDAFLKNAFVFRLYFEKLDAIARAELCAALTGPAFNTLMDSLKLKVEDAVEMAPPSEEQVQFYLKNFSEFHEAMRWQEEQFFGFLPHLTTEQLLALVRSQSPVIGALILKFSKPDAAALVLENLEEKSRLSVIDQFERTREMSPDELKSIEKTVRASVRTLPNFILGTARQEQEYWSHLLSSTQDPSKLLLSLEEVRPDLYNKLAKFRFQLQDLPSLPSPLVRKVLDDMENDEIARAFSGQSSDLVAYALNEMPAARRRLLEDQILSYQNVENFEVQKSIETLTRKFREVLA